MKKLLQILMLFNMSLFLVACGNQVENGEWVSYIDTEEWSITVNIKSFEGDIMTVSDGERELEIHYFETYEAIENAIELGYNWTDECFFEIGSSWVFTFLNDDLVRINHA